MLHRTVMFLLYHLVFRMSIGRMGRMHRWYCLIQKRTAPHNRAVPDWNLLIKTTEPAPTLAQEAPVAAPAPEKAAPTVADASKFIGQSASALAAAIGQPNNKTYASSCIGDGEDGEWYYNGFTVYTYRDTDGSETVEDVFGN